MDDELYPNSGEALDTFWQPTEPEDQKRRREAGKSVAASNKNIIKDMIARLEKRVAFYSKIDSIPDDAVMDPDQFRIHVAANKQTVANLQIEINQLKGVLKTTR